jgi:hypothetical protein
MIAFNAPAIIIKIKVIILFKFVIIPFSNSPA